jgi:sterol desaturase/sphingolipid hydroxylase (fatty acid hydroxylase superfamily)
VFNGHIAGVLIGQGSARLLALAAPGFRRLEAIALVGAQPLWMQFVVAFDVKDHLEYGVHNLLRRVNWLSNFHRVHQSIEQMDWVGNFRFHRMEIVVYRGLTYVPLAVLGVDGRVLLVIAVASTLIGHLHHSNLDITWGPLRDVSNSPRMHVWHHDRAWPSDRPRGLNDGVSLSARGWSFGTAWWPSREERLHRQPERLGFDGVETYPSRLIDRLLDPLSRSWSRRWTARSGVRRALNRAHRCAARAEPRAQMYTAR